MDATEKQLITDIERLREEFTQTQDLYREVCALLFFRYGLTPTANKLYQLVRKGSMTAPADALNKFWEDLREKSRVRIEPGTGVGVSDRLTQRTHTAIKRVGDGERGGRPRRDK